MKDRNRRHRVDDRGSQAVQTLERAWTQIRDLHTRVPQAVIVLLDVTARPSRRGHFATSQWKTRGEGRAHEIGLSPALFADHMQLLATLLHEAAHAALFEETGNPGIGSTRYYHTKQFRDCCQEFGLQCEFLNSRYGWTITQWPGGKLPSEYRPVLASLRTLLPFGTQKPLPMQGPGRELPKSGQLRLSCGCRAIYASRAIAEEGGLLCELCGCHFGTTE